LQFGGRGWNANHVEIHAAQEHVLLGRRARREAALLVSSGDEAIDRMRGPGRITDFRQRRTHRFLKRPVLAGIGGQRFVGRRRAGVDPRSQRGDLDFRERLRVERHPLDVARAGHGVHQQALVALGGQRRSAVAALANEGGMI
jgi:hypothetical protein